MTPLCNFAVIEAPVAALKDATARIAERNRRFDDLFEHDGKRAGWVLAPPGSSAAPFRKSRYRTHIRGDKAIGDRDILLEPEMKDKGLTDRVIDTLYDLQGKGIRQVIAGPSHGTTLIIDVGSRVRRDVPLVSHYESTEERDYESEFALMITCSWRLMLGGKVVCGSLSRNEADGEIAGVITRLVGRKVTRVQVDPHYLDFTLNVEGGRLSVFCDELDIHRSPDNYSIRHDGPYFVVGPRSLVRTEDRALPIRKPLGLV